MKYWHDLLFDQPILLVLYLSSKNYRPGGIPFLLRALARDDMGRYIAANWVLDEIERDPVRFGIWRVHTIRYVLGTSDLPDIPLFELIRRIKKIGGLDPH